ncbi:hypothetical protein [Rhodococcus gannanensis]|uniref:Uncharacterized protein n=1 Tax=Rhodococcus gannanensis TaxID=1960308 RepID=A0ABW4NYS6_9NOCA
MKENWGLLVPYLAMITGCQLFATSLSKVLSALPFKKLDRLGKTIEAACGLASATMLVGAFVLMARESDVMADVAADERLWLAREFALLYGVVALFYLGWAIAIVFGGPHIRFWAVALSIGFLVVAWATTLDAPASEQVARVVVPAFFTVLGLIAVPFFAAVMVPGLVHRHVVARWRAFVHWLEPTDLRSSPHSAEL